MIKVYKNLKHVQTPVLAWGDPFNNSEDVIICITGNPGLSDFYINFGSELYNILSMPVCIIGHAGHEESLDKKNKGLFNLMEQLEHKLDFIENHINRNSKLHLIGHSIGAWMAVELLQKDSKFMDRVASVNLLFPTIQRMAESKNGKFVNNGLRKFSNFILFLSKILFLLPECVLSFIIGIYLWITSLPFEHNSVIVKLLHPDTLENILYLAFSEMDNVTSLNVEGVKKIKHITNVIYAANDGWAPIEYIKDLYQFKPELQFIEAHNIEHAFVLKSSEKVASFVADFIKVKINR